MNEMTDTEKMVALMRAMKRGINGAVAEAMERRGIRYPASWGVAVPDIRKAAAAFAPDHSFARFLWQQQLRELRLAALTVADPAAVDAGELDFWGDGTVNPELAENLAFSLLSRTGLDEVIAARWGGNNVPPLLNYCMLLTLARMLRTARAAAPGPGTSTAYDALRRRAGEAATGLLSSTDRLVAEAADNLLLTIEDA